MKIKDSKRLVNYLRPVNSAVVQDNAEYRFMDTPFYSLMLALADAIDTAIEGDNTYCIIGTTKDVTAISFTIVQGSARDAVYGDTLAEIGSKSASFLTP